MATLKNHPGYWLRDDAAAAFDAAEAKHGKFKVNSAGRTVAEQQKAIDRWDKGGPANRPPYLYRPARPATASNHVRNGGVAVDIGDWQRFRTVCEAFGFRWFGNSDVVHFDYVGRPGAAGSTSKHITVGRSVKDVQRVVGTTVDGIWGPKTEAAVRAFQKRHGLAVDGIWGPRSDAAGFPPAKPAVKGSALIRAVQQKLKSNYPLYASKLVVDGIQGPKTTAAVKEFQRRSGLVVDGIVGPKTRKALGV